MAKLAAARTPVKTPGQGQDVENAVRTPVKTPLRTDLEEAIFNELMDADHGPHWTSPAKSDEELFVEIAKENGSSVASDDEEAPPVYEAVRPPPAPPQSAARPPPPTPPHLAEALAPYAALSKGSPEDVRQRLRAATTTLKRRLDAGLPLRTLVWDRAHERYAVATLVLFRARTGVLQLIIDATSFLRRRRLDGVEADVPSRRRRGARALAGRRRQNNSRFARAGAGRLLVALGRDGPALAPKE